MDLRKVVALLVALAWATPASAQLIAFVSSEDAPVTLAWQTEQLPFLEELAEQQHVELRVVDVAKKGAPAEVGITPLVVFQNHRGRSVYQGRSSNRTRLANFVRTSRVIAQSSEPWIRNEVPVWQCERTSLVAPLKITELAGVLPGDHDAGAFEADCSRAILSGLERFKLAKEIRLKRSDRTFYFDFYPYRAESGQFFVSVALFSQFHCKEAIYRSEESFSGTWEDRAEVLQRAARALESETVRLMRESKIGDAFDCVPSTTAKKTWEELDLALPAAPPVGERGAELPQLKTEWRVADADKDAAPRVLFQFPAPLDGTAGEVESVSGKLTLGEGASLSGARGQVVVAVDSISMGFPDLDEAVLSAAMLDVDQYPEASFTLEKVLSQEGELEFGGQARTLLQGTFEMKGKPLPIEVTAIWEPIVNQDGKARLLVDGAFSIRLLEPFGIKGPDGPSPQKDTLNFHFALELE